MYILKERPLRVWSPPQIYRLRGKIKTQLKKKTIATIIC